MTEENKTTEITLQDELKWAKRICRYRSTRIQLLQGELKWAKRICGHQSTRIHRLESTVDKLGQRLLLAEKKRSFKEHLRDFYLLVMVVAPFAMFFSLIEVLIAVKPIIALLSLVIIYLYEPRVYTRLQKNGASR